MSTNLIHVIFQKGNYTVMSRRITCSDSFLLALNKVLVLNEHMADMIASQGKNI